MTRISELPGGRQGGGALRRCEPETSDPTASCDVPREHRIFEPVDHQRRQVEQAQELRPVARSHRGNRLAGQADRLVSLDATIDVAAHEVELILSRAARAITVREGKCRTHEPLPAEHAERLALIERLAAGLP